jgi:predicted nuclease with TOPRIM domain
MEPITTVALTIAFKWLVGAAVTYFVAKKGIETFGNTPSNSLADLGIPKAQQYEDAKKLKKDKRKFFEELNEETKKEIEELYKKVETLEEQKTQIAEKLTNAQNEEDKDKFTAQIKSIQEELKEAKASISKKEREIKERDSKIEETFKPIGNPDKITEEQFVANSNAPSLNSWLNWGIIAIGIITAVLAVRLIFAAFKKFNKEIG